LPEKAHEQENFFKGCMSSPAVLIVPACETGRGGGHLNRSLFLLRALEESGRETFLWISEYQKDNVFQRFRDFFEGSDFSKGFHARLLSGTKDLSGRNWEFIILDRFKTPAKEFAFWSGLGPLIGIDEGGPCRSSFDFLIDLLPALGRPGTSAGALMGRASPQESNLSAPGLLPLPSNRRPPIASKSDPAQEGAAKLPLRVLVSFGAEDAAGLGLSAAQSLARKLPGKAPGTEITLIAPNRNFKDRNLSQLAELAGVRVIGMLPRLREHLAEYDLFITHFGIGAFEAVYARLPVLLVSPTAYHEKLGKNAGFFSLGIGAKAARRLENFKLNKESLRALGSRGEKIARRYGLEADQEEDLGSFLGGLAPRSPRDCPVCGEKIEARHSSPVLARRCEETYRRCNRCGTIYLSRLKPPPIEYEKDYFFDFYKKQYGKTYLEDFPNLVEMGRRRMANIMKFLDFPLTEAQRTQRTQGRRGGKINYSSMNSVPSVPQRLYENDFETKPSLLDIGCAYGPFLAAAAEYGFSPCGIEPAEDAVRYVKEELGFHAWHGFFPDALPNEFNHLPDGRFDVVTLWYVIEHFEEPLQILREIHRLLKEGGVLAFSTPSFSGISGRKSLNSFLKNSPPDHWTMWSPKTCKKVLRQSGFRLRKIVVTGHHPERFPLVGSFVQPEKKCRLYRLLLLISRIFRLGDTFEAYAVKQ